jgi:hypothetical protein
MRTLRANGEAAEYVSFIFDIPYTMLKQTRPSS